MSLLRVIAGEEQSYQPGYGAGDGSVLNASVDPSLQLRTRGLALTDEGSFVSNFANSSLAVTIGTCTFTNGSSVVTGTALDTYDLHAGDYVYLTADGVAYSAQVDSFTPTSITLVDNYTGTGGTGASSRQIMNSKVGAGGSIAVSNGVCVLTSGTTNSAIMELEREVDYWPLRIRGALTLSAAPGANSTCYFGFYDETLASSKTFARFKFTGTGTTQVVCETGWNPLGSVTANETQSTTATIPGLLTTQHLYEVFLAFDAVQFSIDDVIVATHKLVIPHPHDSLTATLQTVNGTGASSYTVTANIIAVKNYNELDIASTRVQTISTQVGLCRALPIWAPNSTTPLTIDTQGYSVVRFHIPAAGTASVLTPSWSDDGTNFTTGGGFNPIAGGAYVATITNATAGLWTMPAMARYLRLSAASTQTGSVIVTLSNRMNSLINPTTTVSASNLQCNVAQMNGVATTMGNGTSGTGVQRVAVASDNTPFSINPAPATAATNACSVSTATALTVANVKASAGNLYGFSVVNKTASALYLQFYNTAGTPTLGTSVIFWIPIAASQTLHVAPGDVAFANFATGIGIGASTTPTSTGTPGTAPEVVIYYK